MKTQFSYMGKRQELKRVKLTEENDDDLWVGVFEATHPNRCFHIKSN